MLEEREGNVLAIRRVSRIATSENDFTEKRNDSSKIMKSIVIEDIQMGIQMEPTN